MKRLLLLMGATALASMSATAAAQGAYGYNTACEHQNDDDRATGALVGALVGGLIGGAIGNNIDDDPDYYGYPPHGKHHGHYHHGYYEYDDDNSDDVVAGALIGALLGGISGAALADNSARECQVNVQYPESGSIPRTTEGLYGGPEMAPRTSTPRPPLNARTYPVSTGAGPADAHAYGGGPAPVYIDRECRTVFTDTRLPDGQTISNPVTVCRAGGEETWELVTDTPELYGY